MSKITLKSASGFTKVADIYQEAGIDLNTQRLYLDKSGDIDIPLLPNEYIVLHGNEVIISGKVDAGIDDNPSVRTPVQIEFNGAKEACEKAKLTSDELCRRDKNLDNAQLFVDLKGAVDVRVPAGLTLVVQDADSYFTIPADDEDDTVVNLEACSKNNRRPPKGQKTYRIKIDKENPKVQQHQISGSEILKLVGKDPDNWTVNQKLAGGRRKPVGPEAVVDLTEPGVERFETVQRQATQGA